MVIFPSGNLLITTDPKAKYRDIPSGELHFMRFRSNLSPEMIKVMPKIPLLPEELEQLRQDFMVLRMTFPVRCKMKACATLVGPCREVFQTNLLVPGVILRRLHCDSCGLKFLVFSW